MERGQKIAVIGTNGIGKTTLFKSILGLTKPISGQVELGDYLSIGYFEQEMKEENRNTCMGNRHLGCKQVDNKNRYVKIKGLSIAVALL